MLNSKYANQRIYTTNVNVNVTVSSAAYIVKCGTVISAYIPFTVNSSGIASWGVICGISDVSSVITQAISLTNNAMRKVDHNIYLEGAGNLVVPDGLPEGSYTATFTTIKVS